jgi:hypothetical protein
MDTLIDQLQTHNLHPEMDPARGGWILPRFPRSVRERIGEFGRRIAREATCGEVRFVSPAPYIQVGLSMEEAYLPHPVSRSWEAEAYLGAFFHAAWSLKSGQTNILRLEHPAAFDTVRPDMLQGRFSPNVWRIRFNRYLPILHYIDTFGHPIRPPGREEVPPLRWLAYGSSITQAHLGGYIALTAQELGVDVLNKGLGGSCRCEPEVADYLAGQEFDFATLELGVNMRGSCTADEFRALAEPLIRKVAASHPGKPIGLITPFLNSGHYALVENEEHRRQAAFAGILDEIASQLNETFVLRGEDILENFASLSTDLIHPSEAGHIAMARNLSRLLREKIALLA